jgi:hypothetical protein
MNHDRRLMFGLLLPAMVLAMTGACVAQQTRADFYIAPNGNDAWSGKLPERNQPGTDGPFATMERARDAIRQLKTEGKLTKPLAVVLRGGTYVLSEPFVLRPQDSGTDNCTITYGAYPGEKPILSGGRILSGWKAGEGPVWVAAVPDAKTGKWVFRQLFVNGERRRRTRLPKEGYVTIAGPAAPEEGGDKAFRFKPGDIRKEWANLDDVEVVVLQFWMAARLRIQAIDEQKHIAVFTGGSWRPLTWSGGYYVENVFEGLDTPGTWYLDRKKGVVYYHPLPGEDMTKADVVAPATQQILRFEGDAKAGQFVRNITVRGLTFSHTDWALPAEGYQFCQAELPPPAAVAADGAFRCRIENCTFAHLGAWGIELRRGCKDNAVVGCAMRDLGAGCLKIGEPQNCREDAEETCRTLVSDNRFSDGGQVYLGAPAVWIGQSSGNTISHNEISGPFMWAVSAGWTWSYFPLQRARDNIIEFNHCHHIGTGILGSHCAIYALGTSPGTVIRNNYIHHIYRSAFWTGAGEGIILDNGCCGILVENNVVHNAVAGGFGTNFNCFGNIIQNNVFAYGKDYQLTVYGDPPSGRPQPKGEVFARNIIAWKDGPLIKESDWPTFSTLWNHNLYFREGGEPVRFMKYSFDQWKAKGLDEDSLIGDPLFVDPAHGDFTLKPTSPAFKLGFRPIDLSPVGPRR